MINIEVVSKQAQTGSSRRARQQAPTSGSPPRLPGSILLQKFLMFFVVDDHHKKRINFLLFFRSTLQTKSKQADYAEDDFEIVGEVSNSK